MATKWSELRERVPAVNELLDTPPLRALSERWNRSIVAAGVRSFLHELKADVERRRAEGQFPSLTELAARAAQHVVGLQQPPLRPAINATGRLLDPTWAGRPLANVALEQLVAAGHGYLATTQPGEELSGVAAAVSRLTGAESATVVHSYSGAVWLALAALAPGKQVLVARAEVGDVEPGCSIPQLAESAGATLREVGAVNRTNADDYEAACREDAALILRHRPEAYAVAGDATSADLESLVAVARERELKLVDALGSAPLVSGLWADLSAAGDSLGSAAASILAGANLVLVHGDGFVGGPRCGILLGDRDLVRRIEQHPTFAAWRAQALTVAALQATLEMYDDPSQLRQTLPLYQLLATSVENLRHRAERLAPQLAQAGDVAAAEAVPTEVELGIAGCRERIPSYGIALTPTGGNLGALIARLQSGPLPIIGRQDSGRLVLDLRSVFPRDDQRLAAVAAATTTATPEDSAQPVGGA